MRGIKPSDIPILVARDIERVEREARIVIDISSVRMWENQDPGLGIIAVVGPGELQGMYFEKVLLCEIGIGKSRPYHYARRPREKKVFIQKRRKWFSLSEEQYRIVAPVIFSLFQQLADEKEEDDRKRREKLENGNRPFHIPIQKSLFFQNYRFRGQVPKKTNLILQEKSFMPKIQGKKFSISPTDEFLLQDVYYVELLSSYNKKMKRHLQGFINFIDKTLARYKKGFSCGFEELAGVKDIKEHIESCSLNRSPHLLIEALLLVRDGRKNPLWPYYCELFEWDGQPTRERQLAEAALPEAESRVGKVQLRVTTSFDGRNFYKNNERKLDHIVFEVYPKLDS